MNDLATVNDDRLPAAGLTTKQMKFAEYVARGLRLNTAAQQAGYADYTREGTRLARQPAIIQEIQKRRTAAIETELAAVAMQTINELMLDKATPAPTRFQASKWVLEEAGHNKSQRAAQPAEKDLSEMNAAELASAVAAGMQALQDIAKQIDGSNIIDGELTPYIDVNDPENDDDTDFLD